MGREGGGQKRRDRLKRAWRWLTALIFEKWHRLIAFVFEDQDKLTAARELTWPARWTIYFLFLSLAVLAARCGTEFVAEHLLQIETDDNRIINPKLPIGIFLFGFMLSIGTWLIRTFDAKKEFRDSLQTLADTIFRNAADQLLSGASRAAQSVALAELARLRRNGLITPDRIDRVTKLGLQMGVELPDDGKAFSQLSDDERREAEKAVDDKRKAVETIVLANADLSDLQMPNADFRGGRLKKAKLCHANLQQALLQYITLQCADLTDADLTGADLTRANLTRANLTRANLRGATLRGADLTCANLTRANLTRAVLTDAVLTGANLAGANLTHADLRDADLKRANLAGADLTRADLRDADLRGAKYDDETTFPEGFDPKAHGMRKVSE